jgi:hypothetical protein
LAISPFKIYGNDWGLGIILSTTFASNYNFILLMTGERESVSSWIIFSEGFSESVINMWYPFPFLAHPIISCYEAPLPIPIVCTRDHLLLRDTVLSTFSVSETAPSVNKNICLGYPSSKLLFNKFYRGCSISVPPRSAFIFLIYLIANSTSLSLYFVLFGKSC